MEFHGKDVSRESRGQRQHPSTCDHDYRRHDDREGNAVATYHAREDDGGSGDSLGDYISRLGGLLIPFADRRACKGGRTRAQERLTYF